METIPWDAARYDRVSQVQQKWGRDVLGRFVLAGDETVLDAGCGTGQITAWIAQALPRGRVLALDISTGMVRQARTLLAGNPRVCIIQADSAQLPFRESVDVVFSNAVFHWVPDHERLFRSLATALRSEGRLEAQCGGQGNLKLFHAAVRKVGSRPAYAQHFLEFRYPGLFAGVAETEQRLAAAGFTQVKVSLDPTPTSFPTMEAFRDFCSAVTLRPFLGSLPESMQVGFVEEVLEALPERQLDYVRLNISAVKPG